MDPSGHCLTSDSKPMPECQALVLRVIPGQCSHFLVEVSCLFFRALCFRVSAVSQLPTVK